MSYWRDFPAGAEPAAYGQTRYYWAAGSAYATAGSLRRHFAATARQAAGMSRQAPAGLFRLQGHVMAAEDILAMWTVEWVIHQLDLTAYLSGDRLAPGDDALALALRTIDELTGGASPPDGLDAGRYLLKGTGRLPLDDAERGLPRRPGGRVPCVRLDRGGTCRARSGHWARTGGSCFRSGDRFWLGAPWLVSVRWAGNRMLTGRTRHALRGKAEPWLTNTTPRSFRTPGG